MDHSSKRVEHVAVIRNACDILGVVELKSKQLECIEILMMSPPADLIVSLPTGYGKSLIYQIFALVRTGCVLVISPLTCLQEDQLQFQHLLSCRITQLGQILPETVTLSQICNGSVRIIHTHPEGLETENGRYLLDQLKDKMLATVIDECHTVEEWGQTFREAFSRLRMLPSHFPNIPHVAMSGTLSRKQLATLPKVLGLIEPRLVRMSPERCIYLDKIFKERQIDAFEVYAAIYEPEINKLAANPSDYPVTLMYMPMEYMADAMLYCQSIFGQVSIQTSVFANIFSNQDPETRKIILEDLKRKIPRIRLVFCTAALSMGFDSPSVANVIHCRPPRSVEQYLQEIGRAGRAGQSATATLHYDNSDIGSNIGVDEAMVQLCRMKEGCLWESLLSSFGFTKELDRSSCDCCIFCSVDCMCDTCSKF